MAEPAEPDLRDQREALVERLRMHPEPMTERVLRAMARVPREAFLPEPLRPLAFEDRALEIGHGQTISAPHMVAIMCSLLDLHPGQKVLEVGAGSGYHAAVLADLVSPGGQVIAVELVPELAYTASTRLRRLGFDNVQVHVADGNIGAPDEAPFDRISVAAAAKRVPRELERQLAPRGRMVIPVGERTCLLTTIQRLPDSTLERRTHGQCVFVPLVSPDA